MIEAFLNQTCTILPFQRDGMGVPVYGAEETRRCRLEIDNKLSGSKHSADGTVDTFHASARLFTVGDPIAERSIVTVEGLRYTVRQCAEMRGFGASHLEVLLE